MRKKMILWIVCSILGCLILSWIIPIKFSVGHWEWKEYPYMIDISSLDLKEYSEGNIVLVCMSTQITGPFWEVHSFYGTENVPKHVDVIGNIPENSLIIPLYHIGSPFIFVGKFSEDNPEVFEATRWEAVGEIVRTEDIIPKPPWYFTIWDMRIF